MTTTKPPVLTDDETRAEFEAWCKPKGYKTLRQYPYVECYQHPETEGAWAAWQAVLERAGAGAWQPIETAPRQGIILLGRAAEGEGDDRSDAICTPGYWQEGWDDSIDDMGCNDGFVDSQYQIFSPSRTFGAEKYRSAGHQPTHWMPLPAGPGALKVTPAAAVADDEAKALDLLATLFDAYENGPTCYEDPDDCAGYLGNAVRLGNEDFQACAELLNRRRPRQDTIAATPQAGQLSGNAGEVAGEDVPPLTKYSELLNARDEAKERIDEMVRNQMTNFGLLVRAMRITAGTTLYAMSKELGVSSATLSGMETGRHPVGPETVREVAAFFRERGLPDVTELLAIAASKGANHG